MVRNTDTGYGLGAILFHWVIAAMFIFQGGLGFYMNDLPADDPATFSTYQLHKSIGLTILLLSLLRLAWRIARPGQRFPSDKHVDQRAFADVGAAEKRDLRFAVPGQVFPARNPKDKCSRSYLHAPTR